MYDRGMIEVSLAWWDVSLWGHSHRGRLCSLILVTRIEVAYTGHSHLSVRHISDMCRDLVGILWNIE